MRYAYLYNLALSLSKFYGIYSRNGLSRFDDRAVTRTGLIYDKRPEGGVHTSDIYRGIELLPDSGKGTRFILEIHDNEGRPETGCIYGPSYRISNNRIFDNDTDDDAVKPDGRTGKGSRMDEDPEGSGS